MFKSIIQSVKASDQNSSFEAQLDLELILYPIVGHLSRLTIELQRFQYESDNVISRNADIRACCEGANKVLTCDFNLASHSMYGWQISTISKDEFRADGAPNDTADDVSYGYNDGSKHDGEENLLSGSVTRTNIHQALVLYLLEHPSDYPEVHDFFDDVECTED